jgi:hypothetical protein
MAFPVKDHKNRPDASTPINADSLKDMETRLSSYTDVQDAVSLGRYRLLVPWRSIVVPTATAAATLFLPEGSSSGIAAATTNSPLAPSTARTSPTASRSSWIVVTALRRRRCARGWVDE